mmetsp:Transcript_55634/g.143323  ORF Transcript_55634/g.143323 Transcript_55634/m.143323 type:complete len:361 (-) Transcript_55634:1489-2571(-)
MRVELEVRNMVGRAVTDTARRLPLCRHMMRCGCDHSTVAQPPAEHRSLLRGNDDVAATRKGDGCPDAQAAASAARHVHLAEGQPDLRLAHEERHELRGVLLDEGRVEAWLATRTAVALEPRCSCCKELGSAGDRQHGGQAVRQRSTAPAAAGGRPGTRAGRQMTRLGDDEEPILLLRAPAGAHQRRQVHEAREFQRLGGCCASTDVRHSSEAARRKRSDAAAPVVAGRSAGEELWLEEVGPRNGLGSRCCTCLLTTQRLEQVRDCVTEAGNIVVAMRDVLLEPTPEQLVVSVTLLLMPGHLLREKRLRARRPWEAHGCAQLVRLHRQARHRRPGPMGSSDKSLLADDDVHAAAEDQKGPG